MVLSDLLYDVVPHKPYYAICWEDIPEEWQMGGRCLACQHVGPVGMARDTLERFVAGGGGAQLRHATRKLRCSECGNNFGNRFTVVGRVRRWRVFPSGRLLGTPFALDPSPPRGVCRLGYRGYSVICAPPGRCRR